MTHKTLTEVEPRIAISATNTPGDADSLFKITAPSSYHPTGSITGRHGIEIVASGVTLDLNGFDLVGSSIGAAVDGVSMTDLFGNVSNHLRHQRLGPQLARRRSERALRATAA